MSLPIHIDSDGVNRPLGCLLVEPRLKWPQFGDAGQGTAPLVPRSEWPDRIRAMQAGRSAGQCLDEAAFAPPVTDQDGIGQCNANGTTSMLEALRLLQGLPYVELSPADLYDRINGGRDQGSMPEDAMAVMLAQGVGTAATCGRIWRYGQKNAPPAERAKYKALEVWQCPTFDHLMSATLLGYFGVSAIDWYDNFRTDADGWLPERGSGGRGGHAFLKLLVADFRGSAGNYRFALGHQNSWTERWGRKGRFYVPESLYGGFRGQWVCRVAVTESGDVPAPK